MDRELWPVGRDGKSIVCEALLLKTLILGAGGMVGHKLAARLAVKCKIGGHDITHLTLHDVVAAALPAAPFPVVSLASDFSSPGAAEGLISNRPDLIVLLASIVSGEAEQDFEKGYRINLDGTRLLLEAIRLAGNAYRPRLVFSSSIAVFGAPFPQVITDDYFATPLTSYGTQKAICELLISDYARRGFVDGVSLRFPTLVVRPGLPNKAVSGFFSNIIREPLAGQPASGYPIYYARRCDGQGGYWHAPQFEYAGSMCFGGRDDRGLARCGRTKSGGFN